MRILLIDDDIFFQKFYGEKLEASGFSVIVASNGEEGLQQIQAQQYDLILLDLIMPQKDGFAVLKELQEKQIAHAPILIFSTLDQENTIAETKKLGALDYIHKDTTDWDATLAKIEKYLTRKSIV